MSFWQTARRKIPLDRALVMGILNVTPDSFSDGGEAFSIDNTLRRSEQMIEEGADIIDVGGESTRPGSTRVPADEEISRVLPVIEEIAKRFDISISVDTSKAEVARYAVDAGAEVINDVSGLRFDPGMAETAARTRAGLVLMHLRGTFETMHRLEPVDDIISEVTSGFRESLTLAESAGIEKSAIALDPGIGFSKTLEQNLELLARIGELVKEFAGHPILVGTSRKSFIGKILEGLPPDRRLSGSLATAAIAVWNGALIVRVHDVSETVEAIRVVEAVIDAARSSSSAPP